MSQKTLTEQQKHDLHLRAVALGEVKGEMTGYPSKDKPWLKYYSEEAISAPLPECTIYEYLWENNKDHLDDVALIITEEKSAMGNSSSLLTNAKNHFMGLA